MIAAGLVLALGWVAHLAVAGRPPAGSPAAPTPPRPAPVEAGVLLATADGVRFATLVDPRGRWLTLPAADRPLQTLLRLTGGALLLGGPTGRSTAYAVTGAGRLTRLGPAAGILPAGQPDRGWVLPAVGRSGAAVAYDAAGRALARIRSARLLAGPPGGHGRVVASEAGGVVRLGGGCPHYCRLSYRSPAGFQRVVAILDNPRWLVAAFGPDRSGLVVGGWAVVEVGGVSRPILLAIGLDRSGLAVLRLPPGAQVRAVAYDGRRGLVAGLLVDRTGRGRLVAWRPADGAVAERALPDLPRSVAFR